MSELNLQKFLLNSAHKSIREGLERYGKNNENVDNIIVWIVGFSVSIITVMLANIDNDHPIIVISGKWIIILTTLTFLFGVTNRIVMVYFNKLQLDLIFSFDHFLSGYNLPENTKYTRFLSESQNTIKEILDFIELDFKKILDVTIPVEGTEEYNELKKTLIVDYNKLQEQLLLFELNHYNKLISDQMGIETKSVTSLESEKTRKSIIWKLINISNLLFILMCISFMASVLVAVSTYLFN